MQAAKLTSRGRFGYIMALFTVSLAFAIPAVGAVAQEEPGDGNEPRDLYIKSANPDGTYNCAKWCNLTEPCC